MEMCKIWYILAIHNFFTYFDDLVRGKIRTKYNDFLNLTILVLFSHYDKTISKVVVRRLLERLWR